MEDMQDLQRKMKSAHDLLAVVKTMRTLAAVNIRQYERAVEALRDYDDTVEMGLQVLFSPRFHAGIKASSGAAYTPPGLIEGVPTFERPAFVVLGSDQGMCGSFNEQVAGRAHRDIAAKMKAGAQSVAVLAVGHRAALRLEDAGHVADAQHDLPSSVTGITPFVHDVLATIDAWQTRREIDAVVIVHNAYAGGAKFHPASRQILPLDQAWLADLAAKPWPTRVLPTFTMDPDRLFSHLVGEYLFVSIYRACAESLAAENASRLASMQAAQRNVEDRLDELRARFRRVRQTSITTELMDIVAGFEVVTGTRKKD